MNIVSIIGNLTKDVELRYSASNNPVAVGRFTVAVTEGYGEKKETSFIPVVTFGKTAESCDKFLRKGSRVGITGRIKTGSYEKQDGTKVYTTDVIATTVDFLTNRNEQSTPQRQEVPRFDDTPGFEAMDDDIPF